MATDSGTHFALEFQGLNKMRVAAEMDKQKGVKAASQQFEALFLSQMLKSMRATVPESGLLGSSATELYTEMHDAQLAQVMAGKGVGLAQLIEKHLTQRGLLKEGVKDENEHLLSGIPKAQPRTLTGVMDSIAQRPVISSDPTRIAASNPFSNEKKALAPHVQSFINRHRGAAELASNASGIPAELILSQAALETGWGKSSIKTADGRDSHNLFGIKAGQYWTGPTTDVTTTEYVNGKAIKTVDRFRVYSSVTEGFADYARLVGKSDRYQSVVNAPSAQAAAHAIQQSGYATDPDYANKLISIMDQLHSGVDLQKAALEGDRLYKEIW